MENTSAKKTAGEELYLVHLNREKHDLHPEDNEDDHDYEEPRKRSRSLGEELFAVHLKRSEGCEPDFDVDAADKDAAQEDPSDKTEETPTQDDKKMEEVAADTSEKKGGAPVEAKEGDAGESGDAPADAEPQPMDVSPTKKKHPQGHTLHLRNRDVPTTSPQ